MKKFDWEKFGTNKIAVWCKTEEEAKDFCKQSHEKGFDWYGRESRAEKTCWFVYKEKTVYTADGYAGKGWFEDKSYTVLPWSDYMTSAPENSIPNLTDEEIFEMLKPKIEKNGIKASFFNPILEKTVELSHWNGEIWEKMVPKEEMEKAIAIAYRSGYGRGQKGRPFNMNQKNKTENSNQDEYFMGRKVINKKPEIGDRVIMCKEHSDKSIIGIFCPHAGVCGKITDFNGSSFSVLWEDDVLNSKNGWWIAPNYLKVIE